MNYEITEADIKRLPAKIVDCPCCDAKGEVEVLHLENTDWTTEDCHPCSGDGRADIKDIADYLLLNRRQQTLDELFGENGFELDGLPFGEGLA